MHATVTIDDYRPFGEGREIVVEVDCDVTPGRKESGRTPASYDPGEADIVDPVGAPRGITRPLTADEVEDFYRRHWGEAMVMAIRDAFGIEENADADRGDWLCHERSERVIPVETVDVFEREEAYA